MTKPASYYKKLEELSLAEKPINLETCIEILESPNIELLSLINASFTIRKKYWGKDVLVHILNNVQNGHCSEDCNYCAQSKSSKAKIKTYKMKSESQIMEEAKYAYESGAFRHCLVFSGRHQNKNHIDKIVKIIKKIKSNYNLQVCVSPGAITLDEAKILKSAGLDRINHNLNTSEEYYKKICTTHKYTERLKTLENARKANLEICSGLIVGMDESTSDIINIALKLHSLKIASIPINFFMPIPGLALKPKTTLTPEYCLRILCLFRFLNPKAEIRAAAGRELHLRHLQPLALYPANSIFSSGYLNTTGSSHNETLQMIKDLGFTTKTH
jgi:biotin synthase